ncbi:MAG: DUF1592 domain-containing protein [Isosphaeraceae bacterium]
MPGSPPIAAFALALSAALNGQGRADDPPSPIPFRSYTRDIRPLLQAYCFDCHNPTKGKGGLDLTPIEGDREALENDPLWARVGERLEAGDMPPSKSRQPSEEERARLQGWVEHVERSRPDCATLTPEQRAEALAGYASTRRLSRSEYANTVRDLLGIDASVGDLLPSEGGGGEGFDNAGSTLFITPVLVEKYLEAADKILAKLLPDEGPTEAGRRLIGEGPGADRTAEQAAHEALRSFLPRAFRRPLLPGELERYEVTFGEATRRGLSYEQAMRRTIKSALVAPSFLFLAVNPPEQPGAFRIGPYELASQLAYFLWSSMPDDELLAIAGSGRLEDPEVIRSQVRRMLKDPRSRGLADSFAAQWLGIRDLGATIRPDARLFPEFTPELASAMRAETILCFDDVIRNDRSLLELLDARYTFVNEALAAHYGIGGIRGSEMRRVELDDPRRGGVLGQAGILAVTSYPHRTSPVLRGRWILEELLGTEVPPPPPDVPVLNERGKDAQNLSLREKLEQHRSKAECGACHSRIDPLGFGLESFDVLGRWREEAGGKPIDNTGTLPTGEEFRGPAELKAILLGTRRQEFLRNLSRKLLGYALAREVNRVDLCVVGDCVNALEAGDFRASRLIETIVLSYPFLHRYHAE